MSEVVKKERLWLWDNLKCFLIFCVVIGHFTDMYEDKITLYKSIFLFVNLFHMPLFLYTFGVFAKSSVLGPKVSKDKVLYFLLLYFILRMLIMAAQVIIGSGKIGFYLFDDRGTQWYMFALVLFLTVGRVFRQMKPVYAVLLSVFIACISGYDSRITTFFSLGRLVNFMPFFLLGLYSDPGRIITYAGNPKIKVGGIVILCLTLYLCIFHIDQIYWIRPLLTGANSFSSLPSPAYGCIIRLLYYIGIFLIGASIIVCMPRNKNIFSFIGQRTLQIYFWHRPLLYLLSPYVYVLKTVFENYWWIAFLFGAVLMTLCLSVSIFGKPLQWLNWHCKNCWKTETHS